MTLLLAIEDADRYVGGAYLVFLLLLLIYVAIMAAKLQRIQRELATLAELADRPGSTSKANPDVGRIQEHEPEIQSAREGAHR